MKSLWKPCAGWLASMRCVLHSAATQKVCSSKGCTPSMPWGSDCANQSLVTNQCLIESYVCCMLILIIFLYIFDKLTAIYSSFSQPSMTARLSEFPRCSNPVAVSEAVFRYYGTFTRTFLSMFEILFLDLDLSRCGSWVLQKRNRLRAI